MAEKANELKRPSFGLAILRFGVGGIVVIAATNICACLPLHAVRYVCVSNGLFGDHDLVMPILILATIGFILGTGLGVQWYFYKLRIYRRSWGTGKCPYCRYDLRGSTTGQCPECGAVDPNRPRA